MWEMVAVVVVVLVSVEKDLGIEERTSVGPKRERVGWRMKKVEPIKMPTRIKRSRCSLKR